MTGSLRRFAAAALLVAGAAAYSKAEEPSQAIDRSLIIAQFDVFNDGDFLLVPVTAFGKTRLFSIDTGCTHMLYDRSLRPFLGEPRKKLAASTPQGEETAEQFDSPKTRLGRLSLYTERPVGCVDLQDLNRLSGHAMEGCIGIAMLYQHVVHIDFDAGKLTFLKHVPEDAGEPLALTWWGALPAIKVDISGYGNENFLIDTGFCTDDAGSVRPELAAKLEKKELVESLELKGYSRDLSGTMLQKSLRLKGLRLGNCRVSDVPVTTGARSRPSMLGLGFLSRFILTFDFPNRMLYLKKSKRFDQPYLFSHAGMILARDDGAVIVESIRGDGPAADAGIQVGDLLLKVGMRESHGARLLKLYEEFSVAGQAVRVELKRGEERIETVVKLPNEAESDSAVAGQEAGSQ